MSTPQLAVLVHNKYLPKAALIVCRILSLATLVVEKLRKFFNILLHILRLCCAIPPFQTPLLYLSN
jgi:hypothetical protein